MADARFLAVSHRLHGARPDHVIYQARFNRYLEDRGLKNADDQKVWAFVGDGELDEPESLGALTLAAREKLDNLIFVINCNLQRLDGPVRGNGKIIQELEAAFRGAGWNVIKVIWGSDWDPLLASDTNGLLRQAHGRGASTASIRSTPSSRRRLHPQAFLRQVSRTAEDWSSHLTDEQIRKLRRGGHDPEKVYAAYQAAVDTRGQPTVILAKTIKGYGLGEAGEGRNITHQQKKLNEEELREFRSRFGIPISDEDIDETPFYRPAEDSPEMKYLRERREALGGFLPVRRTAATEARSRRSAAYSTTCSKAPEDREVSTTMAFVRICWATAAQTRTSANTSCRSFPTRPAPSAWSRCSASSESIRTRGSSTSRSTRRACSTTRRPRTGRFSKKASPRPDRCPLSSPPARPMRLTACNMIPVLHLLLDVRIPADRRPDLGCRGLRGHGLSDRRHRRAHDAHRRRAAASGRTQPCSGSGHPSSAAYDPAYAYEIGVIVKDGLRRMLEEDEDVIYYLTVMNEFYRMPAMPEGVEDGILKGIYKFRASENRKAKIKAHLLASGTILNEAVAAQRMLEDDFGVASDVWSVTSFKNLYWDALAAERTTLRRPQQEPRSPYIRQVLADEQGVFVAATDYLKALPAIIAKWVPGEMVLLGTDGYGRSDTRTALRDFFEVDARHIAYASLAALVREKRLKPAVVEKAAKRLDIDAEKANPLFV